MKFKKLTAICLTFSAMAQTTSASELDGIWQSDGYGMIAEIKDGKARSYQFAGHICIPESRRWEPLSRFLEGITIAPHPDGQSALVAAPFAEHRIRVNRIPSLPVACTRRPDNTALGNYDAFVAFFAQNYAFFDLYDVDWPSMTAKARTKIGPHTTDADLFQIMAELMAPLKDGHLELNGRAGRRALTYEPNIGRTHRALLAKARASGDSRSDTVDAFHDALWMGNIHERILSDEATFAGNKRIQYGVVRGDIGYLALVTLAGYSRKGPFPERDLSAVNEIMEEAITRFQETGVRAVVIDLSANYGGFDFVSRAIAERFAAKETHAYSKHAGDAQSPIRTRVTLTPSTGARFEGPVYVMTSNITVSAGEILTMALRSLPNVTHVGEPTRGALSDVLDRTLPNGWELSLSNEVYLDSDGKAWEGAGIQPQIERVVLPDHDPIGGHLKALNWLFDQI